MANTVAYPFMASVQILCTMVAMNIFVAVICSAFEAVRQEGQASAFVEEEDADEKELEMTSAEGEWLVP
eukprot:SAG11_NODE_38068_length_254_cov_0.651613_1_plen_68_part_10